jgi:hypothetical protein
MACRPRACAAPWARVVAFANRCVCMSLRRTDRAG